MLKYSERMSCTSIALIDTVIPSYQIFVFVIISEHVQTFVASRYAMVEFIADTN